MRGLFIFCRARLAAAALALAALPACDVWEAERGVVVSEPPPLVERAPAEDVRSVYVTAGGEIFDGERMWPVAEAAALVEGFEADGADMVIVRVSKDARNADLVTILDALNAQEMRRIIEVVD